MSYQVTVKDVAARSDGGGVCNDHLAGVPDTVAGTE